jgi:hypothetical protein
VISHWKGIIEEINFGGSIMPSIIIEELDPEKPSFGPSKWPRKLKLLKIINCQNCQKIVLSQLEKVGGHQYPYGSIINIRVYVNSLSSILSVSQEKKICFLTYFILQVTEVGL